MRRILPLLVAGLLPFGLTSCVHDQSAPPATVKPHGTEESAGPNGWWATQWSDTEGQGFGGRPARATETANTDTNLIIRYSRYTTEYDVAFHSPIWAAYTLDAAAMNIQESQIRVSAIPGFARPSSFFTEPLVATRSRELHLIAATDDTFEKTFDPRFPLPPKSSTSAADDAKRKDRMIQRGHMVPNNAMKSQGDENTGQLAQRESFSVANIVPQMANSNSPSWKALEAACFQWAKAFGRVWLIVGPVYHDRAHPTFIINEETHQVQVVPSPDELFYVVIGRRDGKVSAVGFLMPHEPTTIDFREHLSSVREIERKTGLNFMPDFGANDEIETSFDRSWLAPLQGKRVEALEGN